MENKESREDGIRRLTHSDLSPRDPYFIATYFIKDDIKNIATKFASGRLLDVGCGNKPYEIYFKEVVNEYVGCDIVQSSENIVDYICPANQLCFEDATFNTIFSTQVLEHVADSKGVIKEAYRVLKKGGYALFTVPFSWELHEEPYDFFRFSKYGLKSLFEEQGFEIISIKANGGKWAAIFQLWLNVLLSTRKYKTFRSRIIKLFFIRLRCIVLYNRFSIWLDKRYFDDILTLNYIVIARK
ncbi:MAG: class I SAM-dependent methyltransferase [Bacteroidota bacterium]